jgi:phage/plasmid-like protein (TIGR03299 family)
MSHMLATIDGATAMAFRKGGGDPWHQLGTPMGDDATVADAMAAAHLNYTVTKEDLFLADGRQIPMRMATVRDDGTILGTVGRDYEVRQNLDAFSILNPAVERFGVTIESAGALYGGAKAWMLARMNQTITVPAKGGNDPVDGFFLVVTAHDGSSAHNGRLTLVRVVCDNTLTQALGDGMRTRDYVLNITHTRGQDVALKDAEALVTRMTEALHATGKTYAALAGDGMTKDQIVAFIAEVFPAAKQDEPPSKQLVDKREQVLDLVYTSPGADAAGETAWGAYNSITYYVDHTKVDDAKSDKGRIAAARSAIFGTGDILKARALALLQRRVLVAA